MPSYNVYWRKTYYASGNVEVDADGFEEAEKIVKEQMGNYEGSMQYDPDDDIVETYKAKEKNSG